MSIWIIFLEFSLAICDCLLVIDAIVQRSIIPYFTSISPTEPNWFIMMYPYFWYPFRGIIVTVTIYMMLAISAERFRAVCYPLSKRHVSKSYMKKKIGLLDIFTFQFNTQNLKYCNSIFSHHANTSW